MTNEQLPPKGKPGRPKLGHRGKRQVQLWGYFTEDEAEAVLSAARHLGVSVSTYIRDKAISHNEKPDTAPSCAT